MADPTTTYDLMEMWKKLATTLAAESAFATSTVVTAVGKSLPARPFVSIRQETANPVDNIPGVWRPRLEFAIFADTASGCTSRHGYLEENWTIPNKRAAQLDSTNLRLTNLWSTSPGHPIRHQTVEGGQTLYRMTGLWSARVTLIPS